MNFWTVYLKPFAPNERGGECIIRYQEKCVENNIFGMGWNETGIDLAPECPLGEKNGAVYNEFLNSSACKNESSFRTALDCFSEIKAGDIAAMRSMNGRYYIGKVSDAAKFCKGQDVDGRLSWYCKVEKWYDIMESAVNVPSIIIGRFCSRSSRRTICRINDTDLKKMLESILDVCEGRQAAKIKVNVGNYVSKLDPDELEDLVGLYIRFENEDYEFIPSSCKSSTIKYEFEFVCRNNFANKITCQVKNQKKLFPEDYESDLNIYNKIYLFSGISENESKNKKIITIKRDELYTFLKEADITAFLRDRLGIWYSLE